MNATTANREVAAGNRAADSVRQESVRLVKDVIERWTRDEGQVATDVPGLTLFRKSTAAGSLDRLYEPSVSLVVQGTKHVLLGDEKFAFGPGQLLITAVDLPVDPQIVAASAEEPYICLTLRLDPVELARLMTDARFPPPRNEPPKRAMAVTEAPTSLIDAFRRLLDVLAEPRDIPMLAPLILSEILYRLLVGEHGERLREVASVGSHAHRIARAVAHLKENFDASLDVEELAERVGMAASTFYRHFRAVTAMSPLQYQKQLRLSEAQRLMIAEGLDAASAGFHVGYESPSHFSRDYRRQFGAPPARHVASIAPAS